MKRFLSAVGCVCVLIALSKPVMAGSYSLGVAPAFLDIALEKPQEIKKFSITFYNYSDAHVALEVFPIDFKQDDTGQISFLGQDAGSYSYSLSSYLSLESNRIDLDPRESKVFHVSVTNRNDISPGGHYAAIVARTIQEGTKTVSAVSPSISSLILLRKVGGERFHLSLSRVDWPNGTVVFGFPKLITLTFTNEGNIHLIPYGNVDIKDMFGRTIYKGIINTASARIFPETQRSFPVQLDQQTWTLPISFNSMTIIGHDSLQKVTFLYKQTFISIHPLVWPVLGLILIIMFIIFRRKKKA